MDKEKRYKKLVEIYQAAYPDLKKQVQYQNAQREWKQVKDSPDEYDKLVVSLSAKAAKRKSTSLQRWVKATSKGEHFILEILFFSEFFFWCQSHRLWLIFSVKC